MNTASMLSLALTYTANGVAIFPCREADGHGSTARAPYIGGGFHCATTDEGQIHRWWRKWPNAVPGLPCRSNGIVVTDADRHGQDDGVLAWLKLSAANKFNPYWVPYVRTPRDGCHCLFRRPVLLRSTKAKIGPAIDVRDNAYVIAAGSVMANGLRYTLENGTVSMLAAAIGGKTLPELPDWLSALMASPALPLPRKVESRNDAVQCAVDVRERLKGLLRTVAFASPGERNAKLHWAACRVGELVQSGVISEEAGFALITQAGTYAGLPAREVIATVKSGLSKGRGSAGHGR